MGISYRKASIGDLELITKLSVIMQQGDYCGEDTEDVLYCRNKRDLLNPEMAMYIAFDGDMAIGFSHVFVRHEWFWSQSEDGQVGYLETIFVTSDYRKQGIAQTLVQMCQDWARKKDCIEFASSCDLENAGSFAFHIKSGFKEIHRIIHFSKEL